MIFACQEHLEQAIDDYIDQENEAPAFDLLLQLEKTCSYCSLKAIYVVKSDAD